MIETKVHRHNDGQGTVTFETVQDATAILEDAKARHNAGYNGTSDLKHAARIPLIFIDKYCQHNNITFGEFQSNKEHIRRVLKDPALSHFRIWKGAL